MAADCLPNRVWVNGGQLYHNFTWNMSCEGNQTMWHAWADNVGVGDKIVIESHECVHDRPAFIVATIHADP